jgi:hypothetical protein
MASWLDRHKAQNPSCVQGEIMALARGISGGVLTARF